MALVELSDVEKRYGDLVALRDVSLRLEPGRIGLLGPNGAGKSTLLKTLLGLVTAERGSVQVLGLDVRRAPFEVRAQIGYMPEGDGVIPELSALAYTVLAAELCGLPRSEAVGRAHQVLHYVGLGEARYRRLGTFSTGMRQRARLAQALVGDPRLLLLDEPTSGLDPRGRDEMLALIRDIPERTGASVLLSTHILPDVEKTCDQVVVLAGGEVLHAGPLAPLVQPDRTLYQVRCKGSLLPLQETLRRAGCEAEVGGSMLEVRTPDGKDANYILRCAVEGGHQIRHLATMVQTLEQAFMRTLESAGHLADEGASGPAQPHRAEG